jgi:DNA-binding SARP family transcriptional activator
MARLALLGTATLHAGDALLTGSAVQRHRLALLALLALAPRHVASRERLVAMLWPDSPPDRGRHLLSVALHVLRRELGTGAIVGAGDAIMLQTAALHVDVIAFESAIAHGNLARAARLYRGPLLDGFFLRGAPDFERWQDDERARLERMCVAALETLALEADGAGDGRAALHWWRRAAVLDPCSGPIAIGAMRALDAAGDAAGALRHARAHAALLRARFDLEPEAAVVQEAVRLRRSHPPHQP